MALSKLEKEIKDRLEARKLQPSKDAWKRLEQKLDKDATPKPTYASFRKLGLAAATVGILLSAFYFFQSQKPIKENII